MDVHEPEQGDGGTEALAEAVAGLDGDAAMLGEGVQHLDLLGPQLHAQHLAGEGDGGGQRRAGGCQPVIKRLSYAVKQRSRIIKRCSRIILSLSKEGEQRVCRL